MAHRNNKKEALLRRKEEILKELKYYDNRIEELKNNKSNSSYYDDDSSDSEEFPELSINSGPSITELKLEASMLRTCLHATQELTNLQILQSEVNVLVDPPIDDGVSCSGVCREVTVECRTDLVPFTMSFLVYTEEAPSSPPFFSKLQVSAIKTSHHKELAASVLASVDTPSDAVQVLCSYSRAHRSRRATLSKLAEKYSHRLHMEPRAEGGYLLRCGEVLEVVWELQNKWSVLADFQHKMKFDLEYMDESYIKIISSAHRQLSEPAVDTEERTGLLVKIIDTCVQAGAGRAKDRGSAEGPGEIMAPPKNIPKKNIKDTRKKDGDKDSRSDVTDGTNIQDPDKHKDNKIYKDKRKATDSPNTGRDKRLDTGNEKIKKDNTKENNHTQKNVVTKKLDKKINVTKTEHLSERFNKNKRINKNKEMRTDLNKKNDVKSRIPQKSLKKTLKKNTLTVNTRNVKTPLCPPRSGSNTLKTNIPREETRDII
ncbi:unnamed protein product [Danaus chrysippus]|uniref:(African queen) hypothetical protein n=1 Tax=Danaus chrysippus TaxID=151541 RepID=A0A8J2QXQ3_9NEOP|nr:unnamed protein product [Danaus chrysippus]